MTACLFINESGWGVVIGEGNDCTWLPGFASHFDAYAFCVAATGIDPLATIPDGLKRSTKRPQPDTLAIEAPPVQASLFAEVTP